MKGKGAGDSLGDEAGSTTVNLSHSHTVDGHTHTGPSHTHTIAGSGTLTASTVAAHTHPYSGTTSTESAFKSFPSEDGPKTCADSSHTHTFSGTSGAGGGHNHTITSHTHGGATGSGGTGASGSTSPGTDTQLSASQSFLPEHVVVNHLIKY